MWLSYIYSSLLKLTSKLPFTTAVPVSPSLILSNNTGFNTLTLSGKSF